MSDYLKFEVSEAIAVLTINRPEKLNAFTYDMLDEWIDALDECQRRDDVRVIILTGAGRSFCTGGDVDSFPTLSNNAAAAIKAEVEHTQRVPRKLASLDKPVIAAINGFATGGGLDIALACDIRFAAESARMAETYVRVGLLPGAGGGYFLPRLVGLGRALELLMSGDFIDAREAERIGLVNRVTPDDELMAQTRTFALRLAANPPLSVQLIKRITRQATEQSLDQALQMAASNLPLVRGSEDHKEAVAAFKEKRTGVYQGK